MRIGKKKFSIIVFESLPEDLKKSDYIDILLFLIYEKPNVRLGKNDRSVYKKMAIWCKKYGYRYIINSDGFMYISRSIISARITQVIDDSTWNHSVVLGKLLGYPNCCTQNIRHIGEQNIDRYEKKLCKKGFTAPYNLINSGLYTEGSALISHVPCCNTCKESLRIARKSLSIIKKYSDYPCMNRWNKYICSGDET